MFVEGWDSPEVRAIILARPFGFCGGYLQACGRALRPAPGKTHATIIDLVGAAILHGLPADERTWSLTGAACRRTTEALTPLARCKACLAVFHAGPTACPRCAALTSGTAVPRRATRIERQELARLDTRPQTERDAIALAGIRKQLLRSGRFPAWRIDAVAQAIFARSRKGRPATPEAA